MANSDEDFLDDDLLDSNDFQALQEQALLATQGPKTTTSQSRTRHTIGNGTTSLRDSRSTTVGNGTSSSHNSFAPPSFEYGDLDEEVLDAGIVSASAAVAANPPKVATAYNSNEVAQREQWRQNRFSAPSRPRPGQFTGIGTSLPHRTTPTSTPQSSAQQRSRNALNPVSATDFKSVSNGSTLEDRLQQLLDEKKGWEQERQQLQREVQSAQEQVIGKSGEISIIRANHAKQDRERERIISELKQQQAQQEKHHKESLEHAKKEKESLVTHNRFLDHEQGDNSWNVPTKKSGKGRTTPKRQRVANIGEGFDDGELVVSPSKAAPKSKLPTPKQGAKRKRDLTNDTPGQSLRLDDEVGEFLEDASAALAPVNDQATAQTTPDSRFEFLQLLLGHRIEPGAKRTFEAFATLVLPSEPKVALSTLFMDKMAQNNFKRETKDYPASIGSIVLAIWSKCLDEHYYEPIRYIIDLIKFILLNGTLATVSHLLNGVLTIAQLTADVNVIPRFRTIKKNVTSQNNLSEGEPSPDVDTQSCLELLLLTATLCVGDSTLVHTFWRGMRIDFLSMILRVCQRVDDIIMTVKMLEPCVQDDILSVIRDPEISGYTSEQHIIDRLTSLLIEEPRPIEGAEPYNPIKIINMRLEILLLLQQICDNKISGRVFALHQFALGRIVRVMNDELTAIYVNITGLEERSEVVNHACRILFYVTQTYAHEISLQEKLRSQPGGVNKYLIALSRLAFSDAIFFERGIEEDVFECAHSMLEDFVTPEEADALRRAFVRDER